MTEAQLIAWFAAHPFWRTEAVSVVAALSPMVVHDYMTFKQFQAEHPNGADIAFDVFIAARRYALAVLVGALPPIAAMTYRVLGL